MRHVTQPVLVVLASVAAVAVLPVWVSGQHAGRSQHTGFEGIWNSATATPLERPAQLQTSRFSRRMKRPIGNARPRRTTRSAGRSRAQSTDRDLQHLLSRVRLPHRQDAAHLDHHGSTGWPDSGAHGRGRRDQAAPVEAQRSPESAQDPGLQDQCLAFLTAGPPMLPYSYNSNYQIMQTGDASSCTWR